MRIWCSKIFYKAIILFITNYDKICVLKRDKNVLITRFQEVSKRAETRLALWRFKSGFSSRGVNWRDVGADWMTHWSRMNRAIPWLHRILRWQRMSTLFVHRGFCYICRFFQRHTELCRLFPHCTVDFLVLYKNLKTQWAYIISGHSFVSFDTFFTPSQLPYSKYILLRPKYILLRYTGTNRSTWQGT